MRATTAAIAIKLILTLAVAFISFTLFARNPIVWVTALAFLGTALNYLLGDLLILTSYGNSVAAISDGLLSALTAYVFSWLVPTFSVTFTSLAIFAVLIAAGEYFFHQYLLRTPNTVP